MKKTILVLSLLIMAFCPALCQEKGSPSGRSSESDIANWKKAMERCARPNYNEINLSYGFLTQFRQKLKIELDNGMVLDKAKSTGMASLGYMRYLKQGMLAVGGIVGYEHLSAYYVPGPGVIEADEDINLDIIYVMPMAKLMWLNMKHFGMYSQVGFGLASMLGDGSPATKLISQLDVVCADFGGDNVRGFCELGVGCTRLIKAGVKFTF